MKESTTRHSLEYLRKQGQIAWVTEQWIRFPEKVDGHPTGKMIALKRDLWNIGDVIACGAGQQGVTLVQTTTTAHQADRIQKLLANEFLPVILGAGNRVEVHGWAMQGARGSRKTWQISVTDILLEAGRPVARKHTYGPQDASQGEASLFATAEAF